MRVLLISNDYPPITGGIAAYCLALQTHLARRDDIERVIVLALGDWPDGQEAPDRKTTVIRRRATGFLGLGPTIFKTVREHRPDLIHLATLFPEGLFTGLIGRLFRIPVLIMFHGLELNPTAGSRKTRLVKKWSVGLATAFATNSQATADRAVRGYGIPADRIKVIHLGQLNRAYRPAVGDPTRADIGLEDDDLVVLGLGRLVGHKGFADLIKAIARTRFQIKLVIVGDGPDRAELVRLTGELGLDRRVTFMGRVDRVEPYYALADMFALASFEDPDSGNVEGFGIVMVEAQAAGLPVIGTDSGGVPEAFAPDRTGLLVPPRNPAALAEAITRLADDPALRRRMAAAGPELVKERYQWADRTADYAALYRRLIEPGKAGPDAA